MFYCLRCDNIDWSELWAEIKNYFCFVSSKRVHLQMEINGDTGIGIPFTLSLPPRPSAPDRCTTCVRACTVCTDI